MFRPEGVCSDQRGAVIEFKIGLNYFRRFWCLIIDHYLYHSRSHLQSPWSLAEGNSELHSQGNEVLEIGLRSASPFAKERLCVE